MESPKEDLECVAKPAATTTQPRIRGKKTDGCLQGAPKLRGQYHRRVVLNSNSTQMSFQTLFFDFVRQFRERFVVIKQSWIVGS